MIQDIRSYTHEEILFPRGISLFEGDIGSGKSTILMAIEFALFGLGSQKGEGLLAKKSDTGYVILEFTSDNQTYEIKRALKRSSGSVNQDPKNSWIKTGDITEPLSPSELKQRVLQILKFKEPAEPTAESKIFRYAIFTPQEEMKQVLGDFKKRLETIRRAFGIEDYSIAQINAKEVTREILVQKAVLQQKFSNISELELQKSNSEKSIIEINSKVASLQSELNDLEQALASNVNQLKELQARDNEKTKLELQKVSIYENIHRGENQIKKIEMDFADMENELSKNTTKLEKLLEIKKPDTIKTTSEVILEIKRFQELNKKSIQLESQKESVSADISKIKLDLGDKIDSELMQVTMRDLENEKKSLARFAEELNQNAIKIFEQKIQKQTLKSSLEKEVAQFSKLGNACPTCKQDIDKDHHHKLVDTRNKEIENISHELNAIAESLFQSNEKTQEIKSKMDSYDLEISQIQKIIPLMQDFALKSAKLVEIEKEIKDLAVNFQNVQECEGRNPLEYFTELKDKLVEFENVNQQIIQIIEVKQKVEKLIYKNQKQVEEIESENQLKENQLKEIESQLATFTNLKEIIEKKEPQIDMQRGQVIQVSSNLATFRTNLANEIEKMEQNKTKIVESKKWQVRFSVITQYQEWLETYFIPAVIQIEKQVLLSILQNFNETYRRWYSILVEDPTKESHIDENFTPIISQDGNDQEITYLSGGEKTSIALAYRLTLNSLMRKETNSMKSNLLILDEPTDGFSKNQLGKIREVLDELKSEQIILVSHDVELETYVDNIFQVSKQDGISKIVQMNLA